MRKCTLFLCIMALCFETTIRAADADETGKWIPISDGVVAQLEKDGKKLAWPGQSAGIAVDRVTGNPFMVISGQGLWRSVDQGSSFERIDGGKIGGRCETGYSLDFDPAGGRYACFMLDGNSAFSLDGGKTWEGCHEKGTRGMDFAAVAWSENPPKTFIGIGHERNGVLLLSGDAGKTWKKLGDKFTACGIFSSGALLASKGDGILRSEDGGATWNKVSDATPAGGVVRVFNGNGYWISKKGMLWSKDQGKTWEVYGSGVPAGGGPYFGKDDKSMLVVVNEGLSLTTDGGQTWKVVAPHPPDKEYTYRPDGWFLNYGWDPQNNIIYASRMGRKAYKFRF
jgi:photosystem II stability/assembly factor-like uncharacterized protein